MWLRSFDGSLKWGVARPYILARGLDMSSLRQQPALPSHPSFWGKGRTIFSETNGSAMYHLCASVNRLVLKQTNQTGFETAHMHTRSFSGCGLLVGGEPTSSAGQVGLFPGCVASRHKA